MSIEVPRFLDRCRRPVRRDALVPFMMQWGPRGVANEAGDSLCAHNFGRSFFLSVGHVNKGAEPWFPEVDPIKLVENSQASESGVGGVAPVSDLFTGGFGREVEANQIEPSPALDNFQLQGIIR